MGSGTSVQEINKLLRQYKQMQIMMKRVKKWATSSSWGAACRQASRPACCSASFLR
jgi:signal recognition particle GTPase